MASPCLEKALPIAGLPPNKSKNGESEGAIRLRKRGFFATRRLLIVWLLAVVIGAFLLWRPLQAFQAPPAQITINDVFGLAQQLAIRPMIGVGYIPGSVAYVDSFGLLESVVGPAGNCVTIAGSDEPCPGSGGPAGGTVQVDLNNILVGTRPILNLSTGPGILLAVSDTGAAISIQISLDTAFIQSLIASATPAVARRSAHSICNTATRGELMFVPGKAGVRDSVAICMKDEANVYAWKNIR